MSDVERGEFLPPPAAFDINARCVKCGCEMVTTTYVARNAVHAPGFVYVIPEHLERTCVRCGHSWQERTLDTGAKL